MKNGELIKYDLRSLAKKVCKAEGITNKKLALYEMIELIEGRQQRKFLIDAQSITSIGRADRLALEIVKADPPQVSYKNRTICYTDCISF